MKRREFLGAVAGAGFSAVAAFSAAIPPDLTITRAVGFELRLRRHKYVGKNAVRDDHGQDCIDRMVRLYTNTGIEAIGRCGSDQKAVRQLLGTNPFQQFDREGRRFTGPLGRATMVLWDLAGRVLGKPVYELLGGKENRRVSVYDGSFYLSDLLPQHASRWQDRFREELDKSLADGHRAVKLKVGRGHKWMERKAGDDRDIEVVRLVRQHVGKDVLIGVDANNGMDDARARAFVDRTAEFGLEFLEEPFPEHPERSLALKRYMAENGVKTMLADGEGVDDEQKFRPLVAARAVDLLQGDMYQLGIEGILAESAMGEPAGIRIAPHNWGTLLPLFMQVHVGLAIPNFYRAEADTLATDVIHYDGYKISDGVCTVPDAPGFGLAIDEERFRGVKINYDVRACGRRGGGGAFRSRSARSDSAATPSGSNFLNIPPTGGVVAALLNHRLMADIPPGCRRHVTPTQVPWNGGLLVSGRGRCDKNASRFFQLIGPRRRSAMSRMQFPPGPKDRMFGMRIVQAIKRNSIEFYDVMRRQYGDVVYMKLAYYHDYTFFHPDHIHELLTEKAKSFVRMRRQMEVFKQWNGKSVLIAEGQDWLRQRRLLQPAFQPKRFDVYAREINRAAQDALDGIAAAGAAEVNFERAMNNLTTAIICRTMFGADLGDELDESRKAVQIMSDAAIKEIMQLYSLPLWVPLPRIRRKRWAIQKLDSIVRRFIKERRAAGTDTGDLLSMMLLATDEQGGAKSLSDQEVRDNFTTIFVAGHDTTAAGLTWLGWFLASRAETAERVRAEIDAVVGERPPTYADLAKLPFLDQTVKETLRHRPPAIGVFSRQVSESVEVGGYTLPKGALVHAMSYNVHHDERWFDSPETFDPDRFSPERIDRIPPNAYFPFGIGPRICIGNHFARMEMMLVAIMLLQRFDLTPAVGQEEPKPYPGVSLRPIGGMRICCRPRGL